MAHFILMIVRKEANLWRIYASNETGSIDHVVSQEGAIQCVKRRHVDQGGLPVQLVVYDADGHIQESWAFKNGTERKLDIALPH